MQYLEGVLLLLVLFVSLFALLRWVGQWPKSHAAGFATLFVVIVLAAASVGCGDTIVNVGGPTQVNNNNQSVGAGPGGIGDTGEDSGPVHSCSIQMFGTPLPKATPAPQCTDVGQKEIRVGCEQAITLNPRNVEGEVIFNEKVTGTVPDRWGLVAGSDTSVALIRDHGESAFNLLITGRKPGILTLEGEVKGRSCTAAFTVVP